MLETKSFNLKFIRQEKHLMLPNVASIVVVQNLYDILFQYVINEEYEVKLKNFIDLLEKHIKTKPLAPFSMPLLELEYLGEGLDELKYIQWMEVPVAVFKLEFNIQEDYESELEPILNLLENIWIYNFHLDNMQIWVYPSNLTRY